MDDGRPADQVDPDAPFIFESIYQEFDRLRARTPVEHQHTPQPPPPSRSKESTIDLRELEYVAEYDSHLDCPICHVPFIDPIALKCDHIFCLGCFMEYTEHQSTSTCPSCRASLDTENPWSYTPRLVINICDDIKVKCPNHKSGCDRILARGFAEHHATKQCDYRLVGCSDEQCAKKVPLMFRNDERCGHNSIQCERCGSSHLQWETSIHSKECERASSLCNECGSTDILDGRLVHLDDCSRQITSCPGKLYGCPYSGPVTRLLEHETVCVFKSLLPYLQGQATKVDELRMDLAREKAKSENLEGSNHRLWETVARRDNPSSTQLSSTSLLPRRSEDRSSWVGSAMLDDPTLTAPASHSPNASSTNAQSARHLLSLHEGLRSQVEDLFGQVTGLDVSLATVDARQSMALMNETLRIKEELAHLNAAMHTLRSQVGWLLNQRNAQLRGREPPAATLLGSAGPTQASRAGPSTPLSGEAYVSDNPRPLPRRSSDGHSSQERVKL